MQDHGLKVPKLGVQISLSPDDLDIFPVMEKLADPLAQSLALNTNTLTDFHMQFFFLKNRFIVFQRTKRPGSTVDRALFLPHLLCMCVYMGQGLGAER